ncbi:MAG: glycosyltransferase family 2 protein [Thermoplasmatales archaeon]
MKKTAVIFSYNDGPLLLPPLTAALHSHIDQIFLLYGGEKVTPEIEYINDLRLVKVWENNRKGKVAALNSIVSEITGEIVFLISGDISFDPVIFERCEEKFSGDVGAISVRVRPTNTRNLTEKIGSMMWEMHDFQLSYLSKMSVNVHGGEFLCIRKSLMWEMPEVINDDEYLCLRASSLGLKVLYLEGETVHNMVPSNPFDLFQQRRRVNFGHLEIMRQGKDPLVMDTLFVNNTSLFLGIFSSFLREKRVNVLYLMGAVFIEFLAILSSRFDLAAGKDHRKWAMVKKETSS